MHFCDGFVQFRYLCIFVTFFFKDFVNSCAILLLHCAFLLPLVQICYFIQIFFFLSNFVNICFGHKIASNMSRFCTIRHIFAHNCIIYISTLLNMMHFCDVKCKSVTNMDDKVQICYIFDAYLSPRLSILCIFVTSMIWFLP